MTVNTQVLKNKYDGDNSQIVFNYAFKIFRAEDLKVVARLKASPFTEVVLAKDIDYSLNGVGFEAGGTISLIDISQPYLDVVGNGLSSLYEIELYRESTRLQRADLKNQGEFFPEVHENVFDEQVHIAQEIDDRLNRKVELPRRLQGSFDPSLPELLTDTPEAVLIVNADGDGFDLGPNVNSLVGITSVNGDTGPVIALDADDIDDTATAHKFTSQTEILKLSNIEDNATADQNASEVPYDNSGTTLVATDVNAALTELANAPGGGGSGTVTDVNGDSGPSITLDTDDISDASATNKYVTQAQKDKLDAIEPLATADQNSSEVPYDNSTSLLVATNVKDAIDEVVASTGSGSVTSVNGDTGPAVVLDKTDIGLGNVDNTADADKPVSTPQQTAIDLKADTSAISTVGFTNDYNDLDNLPAASSGEANTASNISVPGAGFFKQKAGVDLQFRKLIAGGDGVSILEGADQVTVSVFKDLIRGLLGRFSSDALAEAQAEIVKGNGTATALGISDGGKFCYLNDSGAIKVYTGAGNWITPVRQVSGTGVGSQVVRSNDEFGDGAALFRSILGLSGISNVVSAGNGEVELRVDVDSLSASTLATTDFILVADNTNSNFKATAEELREFILNNSNISDLADVVGTAPSDGDVLSYDSLTGQYIPGAVSGGGSSTLVGLSDVNAPTPADGDVLVYNSATSEFDAQAPAGGGGGGGSYFLHSFTNFSTFDNRWVTWVFSNGGHNGTTANQSLGTGATPTYPTDKRQSKAGFNIPSGSTLKNLRIQLSTNDTGTKEVSVGITTNGTANNSESGQANPIWTVLTTQSLGSVISNNGVYSVISLSDYSPVNDEILLVSIRDTNASNGSASHYTNISLEIEG